jgi:hypothetical protein
MKKNIMKTKVLPSSGKLLSMMVTSLRILGTLLTDLKGLSTLSALSMLNLTELSR